MVEAVAYFHAVFCCVITILIYHALNFLSKMLVCTLVPPVYVVSILIILSTCNIRTAINYNNASFTHIFWIFSNIKKYVVIYLNNLFDHRYHYISSKKLGRNSYINSQVRRVPINVLSTLIQNSKSYSLSKVDILVMQLYGTGRDGLQHQLVANCGVSVHILKTVRE